MCHIARTCVFPIDRQSLTVESAAPDAAHFIGGKTEASLGFAKSSVDGPDLTLADGRRWVLARIACANAQHGITRSSAIDRFRA